MKMGTDNYIWDNVINPNMNANLIQSKFGLNRGIRIEYNFDGCGMIVEVNDSDNIGTNYKNARNEMIKLYKKRFKEVN